MTYTIRFLYPFTLLEGQGMGTAYEYDSKLRVIESVIARTSAPRSMVTLGLPEKHGYDLDFVLLAHYLRSRDPRGCSLIVCEDRAEILAQFRDTLHHLPDPAIADQVESVQIDSLTDWCALVDRYSLVNQRFDWVVSTASVQRLPNEEIVTYIQNARQIADYAFLFVPNRGNRAHLTLSGLRGLDLDEVLVICQKAVGRARIVAAGYCDIPPFPPGLKRSQEAKEKALHNPLETLAMWGLEWWCRCETLIPRSLQSKLAHLVYVALDLREGAV